MQIFNCEKHLELNFEFYNSEIKNKKAPRDNQQGASNK